MTDYSKIANAAEYFLELASEAFNRVIEARSIVWANAQPKIDFKRMPLLEGAFSGLFYPDKGFNILVIFDQDNGGYTTYRVLTQVGKEYFLATIKIDDENVIGVEVEASSSPLVYERFAFRHGMWVVV